MNKEEAITLAKQIKGIPYKEAWDVVTPLQIHNEISQKQWEWLMAHAQKPWEARTEVYTQDESSTPDEIEEVLRDEFCGSQKISGDSQKARLCGLLNDGAWHDTLEIRDIVYGGSHKSMARIASRINDLKNAGIKIEGSWKDKKAKIYQYRKL